MSLEEWLKLLATFITGSLFTALAGPYINDWYQRRELRVKQKESRWAPLRRAARNLEERLEELSKKYLMEVKTDPWAGREWKDGTAGRMYLLPSEARDFHELYLLDGNPEQITNWYVPGSPSPGVVRENKDNVTRLWTRLHELTYAANSLHRTAEYLAHAERAREELADGRFLIAKAVRKRMSHLLEQVRQELHGTSPQHPAAGVIYEHQELIGKNMWTNQGTVIDLWRFYGKLLSPEWAQFTDLFRFFIEFHLKIRTEVDKTKQALRELWREIETVFPELSAG
jgi:hypothetical protein